MSREAQTAACSSRARETRAERIGTEGAGTSTYRHKVHIVCRMPNPVMSRHVTSRHVIFGIHPTCHRNVYVVRNHVVDDDDYRCWLHPLSAFRPPRREQRKSSTGESDLCVSMGKSLNEFWSAIFLSPISLLRFVESKFPRKLPGSL